MKTLTATMLALACAFAVQAQTPVATPPVITAPSITDPPKARLIEVVKNVQAARALVLAVYPSYAPEIITGGKKDQWGFGAAALYPITPIGDYVESYTGIRVDYLGSHFWAPSVSVGLKGTVKVIGITAVPIVYSGGVVALSGAGNQNGDFGYILGGGAVVRVWAGHIFGKEAAFDIAAAAEKWSQFDGNVYHIAPVLKIKW